MYPMYLIKSLSIERPMMMHNTNPAIISNMSDIWHMWCLGSLKPFLCSPVIVDIINYTIEETKRHGAKKKKNKYKNRNIISYSYTPSKSIKKKNFQM